MKGIAWLKKCLAHPSLLPLNAGGEADLGEANVDGLVHALPFDAPPGAQSEPMMRLGSRPARGTNLKTLSCWYWSIFFSFAVRHCARCGERRYSLWFFGMCPHHPRCRLHLTRPRGKTPKEPKGYPQEPQEANHVRHPSNSTRGPHQRVT
eukprot:scaffold4877_cov96-Phaeocystis_antarctica.AAC.1